VQHCRCLRCIGDDHEIVFDQPFLKSQIFSFPFSFPTQDQLVTIWSAPNYCYRCGNVASMLVLEENLQQRFLTFEAAPTETRFADEDEDGTGYFGFDVVHHSPGAMPDYFL